MGKTGSILGVVAGVTALVAVGSFFARPGVSVPAGDAPSQVVEERLWHGVAPQGVTNLIEVLDPMVEEHPDLFGGVALAYDRQSVELFVADDDYAKLAPEVAALVQEHPDIVNINRVQYSLSALDAAQLAIGEIPGGVEIAMSGIDVMNNSLNVGVESEEAAQALKEALRAESLEIPVQIEIISAVNAAGQ